MSRARTRSRRLPTALGWPWGIAITSWDYMWRTTPLHRSERAGSAQEDAPPRLPEGLPTEDVQTADDGVGPLFHRRYSARIRDARLSPEELMATITEDPNRTAPTEFARFRKVRGEQGPMQPGDVYVVRMPGPWDGPVRVVSVTPRSFRLVTLAGHLEAGQIEFRAHTEQGRLVFTIESWARSGDRVSKLLYQSVRMAKEVQLHMWTSFLERVARITSGSLAGGIQIDTRRID